MLYEQTQESLLKLRCKGMAVQHELQHNDVNSNSLSFDERFGMIVDAESHERNQRKQTRLLREAKLKYSNACVEDIIYKQERGFDRKTMVSLTNCQWVDRFQHLILTGKAGTGKSWLACAFGQQMIRKGKPVMFRRFSRLFEETDIARGDGSLPKLRAKMQKACLLIIDDWGLFPLTPRSRLDLFEYIEDKSDTGSLLITSQIPVSMWYDYIDEPTIADAILDRIVHRAHQIDLDGGTMRVMDEILKEDIS